MYCTSKPALDRETSRQCVSSAYTNVRWRDKEAELAQKQADTELRSVLTAEIEARVRCRSYEQRIENAWRNRV